MVLTDEQVVTIAMFVFVFIFMFALGARKHPVFYVLCGIVGMAFAGELYALISSLLLSLVIVGVSAIIITFGFVQKPMPEVSG